MYRSATAAIIQLTKTGKWMLAIVILENPGVSDVKHFIRCDTGEVLQEVWDYRLTYYNGCFTIPKDAFRRMNENGASY